MKYLFGMIAAMVLLCAGGHEALAKGKMPAVAYMRPCPYGGWENCCVYDDDGDGTYDRATFLECDGTFWTTALGVLGWNAKIGQLQSGVTDWAVGPLVVEEVGDGWRWRYRVTTPTGAPLADVAWSGVSGELPVVTHAGGGLE